MEKSTDIVLYRSKDGSVQLDVQVKEGTVWLSQYQMGELFGRDQSVISRHILNIFKEGELLPKSNMQKMHIAGSDKPVVFYSLDAIISTGYRVKSKRGTEFRIWATQVLKQHLVQGCSINNALVTNLIAGK